MKNVNDAEFWNSIYKSKATGWDMGSATPVFCTLAEGDAYPPGWMLVVGAGRGYDARMFARHGYHVTAIDFAPEAIRDMHAMAETDVDIPVSIVKADLFDLPAIFENRFDYVLEYVTYCAIDPARRAEYTRSVASALAPGGRFIGLMFPIENRPGGPPFAVDPDETIALFQESGLKLEHREAPVDTIAPRKGREELIVMRKS
jgi:SAM-dependent methyltransferase